MAGHVQTSSWNASSWLGVSKSQSSLKKTIQGYKGLSQRLKTKLDQLTQKKEELDSKAFIVVDELPASPSNPLNIQTTTSDPSSPMSPLPGQQATPPSSPDIRPVPRSQTMVENDYHHCDLNSLASTVTNILIESVQIRLSYVTETITYLTNLYHENPKSRVPPELMLSRYEEWVRTNQRLFELNSRLYDLEKVKFDLQKQKREEEGEGQGHGEGARGTLSPRRKKNSDGTDGLDLGGKCW